MYNMTSDLGLPSFEHVLEEAKKGVDALIVVSGGIDSAYCLWKYSQVVTDRPIYLHHLDMYPSKSKRIDVENIALGYQMNYLKRDFRLISSVVDTSDPDSYLMTDWVLTATLTTGLAQKYGTRYIVVGDDLPDSYHRAQEYNTIKPRKKHMYAATGELIKWASHGKVELCTASETPNLSEAYNEMPDDYIALTTSCREPERGSVMYRQCGKCFSCFKNMHFGWWDRIGKEIRIPTDGSTD